MELLFKIEDFPVLQYPLFGVPNKNSRRYNKLRDAVEHVYIWHIDRYYGTRVVLDGGIDNSLEWLVELQYFDAVGAITGEEFIRNLNEWKCFDALDYLPREGDCITIKYCTIEPATKQNPGPNLRTLSWMQAIFSNGVWVRNRCYNKKLDTVAQGIVYIK